MNNRYVAIVYDLEGIPQYATCQHGVITVFTSKREAQAAVKFMQDLAPFSASGHVERIRLQCEPGFVLSE